MKTEIINIKVVTRQIAIVIISLLLCNNLYSQVQNTIKTFPYYEGFESKSGTYKLTRDLYSNVYTDTTAVNTGYKGLLFKGSSKTQNWIDSVWYTQPSNAWKINGSNLSSVTFEVDASKIGSLILKFDLRQNYMEYNKDSWFRVMVNGKQIRDIKGNAYFTPFSHRDVFEVRTYNLRTYAAGKLNITLQSCCKNDKDCVMIDNVCLDNPDNVSIIDENSIE